MGFLIGLFTVILFLTCVFLVFLILLQLPKKEAGMGTAFGGAATDALFGSGTGTALTTITKYTATVFFLLALTLSVVNARRSTQSQNLLKEELAKQAQSASATVPLVPPGVSTARVENAALPAGAEALGTNRVTITVPTVAGSNAPAAGATGAAPLSLSLSNAAPAPAASTPAPASGATNRPASGT